MKFKEMGKSWAATGRPAQVEVKECKYMKNAEFSEYQEVRAEIRGGECRECTDTGETEFWSNGHQASRKHEEEQAGTAAREKSYGERRKQVIRRLYALIYWFADAMLSEEEAESREEAEYEREKEYSKAFPAFLAFVRPVISMYMAVSHKAVYKFFFCSKRIIKKCPGRIIDGISHEISILF